MDSAADPLLVLRPSTSMTYKPGLDTATYSGRIVPMYTKKQCDREMKAGAKFCSRLRPAQIVPVCRAANMARYAACLAGANA